MYLKNETIYITPKDLEEFFDKKALPLLQKAQETKQPVRFIRMPEVFQFYYHELQVRYPRG